MMGSHPLPVPDGETRPRGIPADANISTLAASEQIALSVVVVPFGGAEESGALP